MNNNLKTLINPIYWNSKINKSENIINNLNLVKKINFSEEVEDLKKSNELNNKINFSNILDENKNDENNDIVPDYVYDVIRKKISRHTFFKKFEKDFKNEQFDYIYFEKELKHNDSWSQFIINNLEKPKIK